jgi:hypothetical protein
MQVNRRAALVHLNRQPVTAALPHMPQTIVLAWKDHAWYKLYHDKPYTTGFAVGFVSAGFDFDCVAAALACVVRRRFWAGGFDLLLQLIV